jgi:predicted nuclease of predicted toxin-antitoxin system
LNFLLDEGLSPRVGALLADAGHDAVHARDLGLRSAADPVILQAAVDSHRVLLTQDTDFGTLVACQESPGHIASCGDDGVRFQEIPDVCRET